MSFPIIQVILRNIVNTLTLPMPFIPELPARVEPFSNPRYLEVTMCEYDAIRKEINTSLSAQVCSLSFGSATTGLLVAAGATLWKDEPLLAGIMMLYVVPSVCFLTLSFYAGEMVRLMRAGLFLNHLENSVNGAAIPSSSADAGKGILLWEQWGIRDGSVDMAKNNRMTITLVFGLLALGFMLAGYFRLHNLSTLPEEFAIAGLVGGLILGMQGFRWVRRLHKYAYLHRTKYGRSVIHAQPY